ncbi:MAG: plasmid maintenance system killer protein [Alphaproteobacteria bacterium]|nr:plasmid maintenance system killer protein [Alphaproteobacteria bacterium]
MIRTVKGSATRQFILSGKSKFSGMDAGLARQRLNELNAASSLADLGRLSSVGLHKLTGDLRGYWSIDVGSRWRILFKFERGDAHEVHIFDPH